jgi:formamidopyrimidine-DNA glycosylase
MPQMQALAERLEDLVGGHALERAVGLSFTGLKTYSPDPDSLRGRVLERTGRRGKFLILDFGGPRILIHLSQAGRIEVESPPKSTKPKGAVVRFLFEDAPSLLLKEYGTERKAGWWVVAEGDDGPLVGLGPEALSDEFAEFVRTGADTRRLHTWMRDQHTVAGIGRGYADDILHRAHLSPYASLSQLGADERERLIATVHLVLGEGLELERGRTGGLPPKLGDHFTVHGRHGDPCPECGTKLERISYASHEVVYCPSCQTGGKTLADRRLSRLVK